MEYYVIVALFEELVGYFGYRFVCYVDGFWMDRDFDPRTCWRSWQRVGECRSNRPGCVYGKLVMKGLGGISALFWRMPDFANDEIEGLQTLTFAVQS